MIKICLDCISLGLFRGIKEMSLINNKIQIKERTINQNKVQIKESGELVIPSETSKFNFIEWGKFDRKISVFSGIYSCWKYDLKQIKRMLQVGDFDTDVLVLLHNGHIGFGMAKPTDREKETRLKRLVNLIEGTDYKIIKRDDNAFIIRREC